ncbi:MAG: SDR family NAD(P)-dependent oxidoreductase [Myxococcales bacterium]|nr:SDR family NAD(P)-dependent oxidoreductase [Myxococcales bacterium]
MNPMRFLITGGTLGMGRGVAHALAIADDRRHEVVILGSSSERGASAVRELQQVTGNSKVSFVRCDLASFRSVESAIEVLRSQPPLDGVFVNAGIGYAPRQTMTEDGLDPHFQVNYLSQFMLVLNLLDSLKRSASGGRVIFNAARGGEIRWDDMQMTKKWGYEPAILQAFAAKRMFSSRLHALQREAGTKLSTVAFEIPKTVWSHQIEIIPWPMRAMATVMKWFGAFISIERCGEIMAPLFAESQAESLARSGKFISWRDGGFFEKSDDAQITDTAQQIKLWDESLRLIGREETSRIAATVSA